MNWKDLKDMAYSRLLEGVNRNLGGCKMWDFDIVPGARKRGEVIDVAQRTENKIIVLKPTKLSINQVGKGTYRMRVSRGGETFFDAKGSNAQLACILGEKRYLPRELGSKSGFTYIDVVEDPDGSGVVDIYRRHVAPKNLGTPIPFKAKVQSEQPASLDDDVEQITGLTDDLEGEVGAGTVAAKAKAAPARVYDVTLRYLGANPNDVMKSVDTIASNLPSQGVTVVSKSVYGAVREGYLKVKTQQDEEGVKSIIGGICSGKRLSDYETPVKIELTSVKPVPADKPLVTGAEAGTQPQQTYEVMLEFVEDSIPPERKEATRRIAGALAASRLTVGKTTYPTYHSAQLTVTGPIDRGALENLLNRNREGATPYETPTISVLNK